MEHKMQFLSWKVLAERRKGFAEPEVNEYDLLLIAERDNAA